MDLDELTRVFAKCGATDPEQWARSQTEEGFPQLARFLFLREAWRMIVPEGDSSWIDRHIERAAGHPTEPFAGAGQSLRRLRVKGVTDEEVTDLVRAMQAELLFGLCTLIDMALAIEGLGADEPAVKAMAWALVELDEDGRYVATIDGLHEDVLTMDPTGREVRPRSSTS